MAFEVKVIRRPGRKVFEAEWVDPKNGKRRRKSLKTKIKRDAERAAAKLEKDILDGVHVATRKTKWSDFRQRYLEESTRGLTKEYVADMGYILDKVEKYLSPQTLQEIDDQAVAKFTLAISREKGINDASGKRLPQAKRTTAKALRYLKRMLRWAHRMKLITAVPTIDMPKGVSKGKSKGRRITTEELERMLLATAAAVDAGEVDSYKRLIRGLWLSGLRIGEALGLQWERSETAISVDLTGKHPMFLIPEDADKSKKARLLPMVPEFLDWLVLVPEESRLGAVFPFPDDFTPRRVSKAVTAIGRKANVFVTKAKPASSHDLRRSFGFRWADLVKPHILQQLMRHETIQTTMEFYVVSDADDLAAAVWASAGEARKRTISVPLAGEDHPESDAHEKTTSKNAGRS